MATLPLPEATGLHYAPYIEELREFFAVGGLRSGSPEDVFELSERLRTSPDFAADLSSMVRSIILREGGAMPHAELLGILANAIGGPEMERAPQTYRQPLRHLLAFLTGVLRRPWNVPPGEPLSGGGELLAFPSEALEARKAQIAPSPAPDPESVRPAVAESAVDSPAEALADEPAAPEPAGSPTLETVDSERIPRAVSATSPLRAFRFRLETILGKQHEADAETHLDPVSIEAVEPESGPVPEPVAAPARAADRERVAAPNPLTTARAHSEPRLQAAAGRDALALEQKFSPQLRFALFAAGGVCILVILLILFAHPDSAPSGSQSAMPVSPPTANAAPVGTAPSAQTGSQSAVQAPGPAAATPRKPSPYGKVLPVRPRQHISGGDEIIAPPHTTLTTQVPFAANPRPDGESGAAAHPRSSIAAPAVGPARALPSPAANSRATFTPDAQFTGEPNLRVPARLMALNLVSAPEPGYPTLARLAHIQGKVVIEAVIAADGSVESTHVLSGHRLLRRAAVDAVRRWRYRPYFAGGRPVDVSTVVAVDFQFAAKPVGQ